MRVETLENIFITLVLIAAFFVVALIFIMPFWANANVTPYKYQCYDSNNVVTREVVATNFFESSADKKVRFTSKRQWYKPATVVAEINTSECINIVGVEVR